MTSKPSKKRQSNYKQILECIFHERFNRGKTELPFVRDDIIEAAKSIGVSRPKNIGDVLYSFRYRTGKPESIVSTEPHGKEWIIEGRGISKYAFRLVKELRLTPRDSLLSIKIPDSTPEIVSAYALSDEQALLAKVRYNRLLDIFLGLTTYSLQNHLRTVVDTIGQVEVDEIYVGIDARGRQFVIPVQAKGGSDRLSGVQARQDIAFCNAKFPDLLCRAISAQFVDDDVIVLFELALEKDEVGILEERHYRLVPAEQIDAEDLKRYRRGK